MGTDAADYDGSGRPSLWCTNYENEMHALYRNLGKGMFFFSTPASGIAAIGQSYVGFGTGFLDLDNHGYSDLVIANGHVRRHPTRSPFRQRPVLLRNQGNGRFANMTVQGDAVSALNACSRPVTATASGSATVSATISARRGERTNSTAATSATATHAAPIRNASW